MAQTATLYSHGKGKCLQVPSPFQGMVYYTYIHTNMQTENVENCLHNIMHSVVQLTHLSDTARGPRG